MIRYVSKEWNAPKKRVSKRLALELTPCSDCHNVRVTARGVGSIGAFEPCAFDKPAIRPLLYHNGALYVLAQDGLYRIEQGETSCVVSHAMTDGDMVTLGGKGVFSAVNAGTHLVEEGATRLLPMGYNSLCVAGDRIVAAGGSTVMVGPVGASAEGFVTLQPPCACRSVVSIAGSAYLLGDSVLKLHPRAEETEVTLTPIAHNLGEVARGSASVCGRKALFAAEGLYLLSAGGTVTRVHFEEDGELNFGSAAACAFKGGWLVSCHRNCADEGDGSPNNVTLLLDGNARLVGLLETGFDALYSGGGRVFAVSEKQLYSLEEGGLSTMRFANVDMGAEGVKHLDCLAIRTRSNADVWVEANGLKRAYTFAGSAQTQIRRLCGHDREFAVEVQCADGMALELLQLNAHICEEVS